MVKIVVNYKLNEKIQEYIDKYGSSKSWIAKQIGYNSRQAMDGAIKVGKIPLETLGRFALFFKCPVTDLYSIKFYEGEKEIIF